MVLERAPGSFQVAPVTLGVRGEGVWEVLEGVAEGDTVVVSAQFLIDSESNLTQALRTLDPDPGGAAPAAGRPAQPGTGARGGRRARRQGRAAPAGHRH